MEYWGYLSACFHNTDIDSSIFGCIDVLCLGARDFTGIAYVDSAE